MDRRRLMLSALTVVFLLTGAAGVPQDACAQTASAQTNTPRIGCVCDPMSPVIDRFRARLAVLGYTEGRNLELVFRPDFGDVKLSAAAVAELLRMKPDVLVTIAPPASHAAKRATTTIPLVFVSVGRPVESGLVASLASPGGNVTGLSLDVGPDIPTKQLELLREATANRSARLSLLWNPDNKGIEEYVNQLERAAGTAGISLHRAPARTLDELETAFRAAVQNHSAGVLALPDLFMATHREHVTKVAATHRIPTIYAFRYFADVGGLMSYGPDLLVNGERAAVYVDKILRGAKPRDLPVEQPTKFELIINLKTAKALGLTMPPSLLARADQVIE
jgi:putative tryptophan/tyrosine transport system substrate-binding protein